MGIRHKKEKNKKKKAPKNKKKILKITLLVVEVLVIAILIFATVMVFVPNSKLKLITAMTSCSPGRSLISCVLGEDYANSLQDKNFNSDKINENEDLSISKKYTNIALFGTDTRSGDLTDSSHTDSIIIVSINNETGKVKMASVYRDTVLEFVADGDIYYDKATNALTYGGIETTINMLNSNLDLNITDYAIVNFAGLANIIDALGGIDLTITEDERVTLNDYLVETRKVTGIDAADVKKSGAVHLNGLQATAYCRNRYTAFYGEDGTVLNNDYARTARQRLVLQLIVEKAKTAGTSEIMSIAKTLFNKNTGEGQFMVTSLGFDEILDLIPTVMDFNLDGNTAFPSAMTSGLFMPLTIENGKQSNLYSQKASCVFAKGLEYNVIELHKFLFGDEDYEPTENVKEINDILIDITGVEPETTTQQQTTKSNK